MYRIKKISMVRDERRPELLQIHLRGASAHRERNERGRSNIPCISCPEVDTEYLLYSISQFSSNHFVFRLFFFFTALARL